MALGDIRRQTSATGVRFKVEGWNVTFSSYSKAAAKSRELKREAAQAVAQEEGRYTPPSSLEEMSEVDEFIADGTSLPRRSSATSTAGDSIGTSDLAQREAGLGRASQTSKNASQIGAYPAFDDDLIVQQLQNPQRVLVEEEIRSFAAGLITDLSPMHEVSNGSRDEQNMDIVEDGTRARRRGLNYEVGFSRQTRYHVNLKAHLWYHAEDGKPYVSVLGPSSSNLSTAYMVMDTYDASNAITISGREDTVNLSSCGYTENRSITEWGSDLYIPQGRESSYNDYCGMACYYNGSTLVAIPRPIFMRDYWGVDDGLAVTERPASLDANHLYNLVNQGWTWEDIDDFNSVVGNYPSNADIPWYGKLGNAYQAEELQTLPAPNGAPKGSVLLSAQSFDRTAPSLVTDAFTAQGSLSTNDIDTDDDQSLTWKFCTEFAGRVIWAAQRKTTFSRTASSNDSVPDMETIIFYSRQIQNQAKAVGAFDPTSDSVDSSTAFTCYTLTDPTSEFFEATPSDGSFYSIPEVGKIMGLKTVGGALLILADNGVWLLSSGAVFDPLNASIQKITNVGCESEKSIVVARDMVFYKGFDGIYAIQGRQGGVVTLKPSDGRIDVWLARHRNEFQDAIYDPVNAEIRWLVHKNIEPGATGWAETGNELKQQELIYNLVTETWTKNRFPNVTLTVNAAPTSTTVSSGTFIAGYVPIPTPVVTGLTVRNDGSTTDEDITYYTPVELKRSTIGFKYLVVDTLGYTFADYTTDTFTDFTDTINEEEDAFLLTLYDNDGNSDRKRQVGHITTTFYRTELGVEDPGGGYVAANQGSCLLDYWWDSEQRTSTENSARRKEIYKLLRDYTISGSGDPYDYGEALITTRNKIRGRGRMLQLEFRSSADKDLQIVGWAISKKVNRRG